ncbi:MAG: beta-propeller fold lactonase family protein, partial [Pseudomonadota bacterium]
YAAPAGADPRLVISADGSHLYHVAGTSLRSWSRDTDSVSGTFGELSQIGGDLTLSAGGTDVTISGDGAHVYTAQGSAISAFSRVAQSGVLTLITSYSAPASIGGANGIAVSPDGEHAIVTAGASDAVLVFRRGAAGTLTFEQELINGSGSPAIGGIGAPASPVFGPEGQHVLVTSAMDVGGPAPAITVLNRRAPDPLFALIEVEENGVDDPADTGPAVSGLNGASAVAVSPDRSHVYVAGLGDDAVSVFARDPDSGVSAGTEGRHLDFIASYGAATGISDMEEPTDIVLSSDGAFLFVASQVSNSINVFSRDNNAASGTFGELTHLPALTQIDGAGADGLLGVTGLALAVGDEHLYSAGRFDGAIGLFDFDPGTPSLTFREVSANGIDGVVSLAGVFDLVVAPSGTHVIAISAEDDSVVVFERDTAPIGADRGSLTFQQALPLDTNSQPLGLDISRDGEHVYVAAQTNSTLYALARDTLDSSPTFGDVRLIDTYVDGQDGIDGIGGARAVAVNRDGSRVYVGAENAGAVAIFGRNPDSNSANFGFLDLLDVRQQGVDGVSGLVQVYDVAVSGDGRHTYAAALDSNALTAFALGIGSSCTAVGSGNIDDTVTIGANGSVTYTAVASLRSDAVFGNTQCLTESGVTPAANPAALCNVATVELPEGFDDPDEAVDQDNQVTDNDTVLNPRADLVVSKTDNQVSAIAGEALTYTVSVVNQGPSDAINGSPSAVTISDDLDDVLFDPASIAWSCDAVGSGAVSFVDAEFDETSGVTTLDGASAVATGADPDGVAGPLGEYVYVASVLDSSLTVFERDPLSQLLTEVASVDSSTVAGLGGARDVVVTADGRYVYVAGQSSDSIVAFEVVDGGGGTLQLNLIDTENATTGTPSLNQPVALALSPGEDSVYVAAANSSAVVVLARDSDFGTLSFVEDELDGADDSTDLGTAVSGQAGASDVVVSADGAHVYVAGAASGAVVIYDRDGGSNGALSFAGALTSALAGYDLTGVASLVSSSNGEQIYVAIADLNAVAVLQRNSSSASNDFGQLTPDQLIQQGDAGVFGLARPNSLAVSLDAFHVYGTAGQSNTLFFFNRDRATGRLSFGGVAQDGALGADGLAGASGVAVTLDGSAVLTAASQDDAVASFSRTQDSSCQESGTGDLVNLPINLAAGGQLTFTIDVNVSAAATGAQLTNTATVSAAIDDATGNNSATDTTLLNPEADLSITKSDGRAEFDGLAGALSVTVAESVGGSHVYVAGASEAAIAILRREGDGGSPEFGELSFAGVAANGVDGIAGLTDVREVAAAADGANVYSVAFVDNVLNVFARDEASGALSSVQVLTDGVAGISGMNGPTALALAPDQGHVYVSGANVDSLAIFSRETSGANAGELTFVGSVQNGADSVTGMDEPVDVVISADDMHVYVAGKSGSSIVAFSRNPNPGSSQYGQLTYVATYTDQAVGIDGIAGVDRLALTDDGAYLYALGPDDQSVAVFSRNSGDGTLAFVSRNQDGVGGVTGLADGGDLLTVDDTYLYIASRSGAAVLRFDINVDGTLTGFTRVRDGDASSQPGVVVSGLAGAAGLAVDAGANQLYVAGAQANAVSGFQRDAVDGSLDFAQSFVDGRGGVAPGDTVEYTIEVSNAGPSDVVQAIVTDAFPGEFEDVRWFCEAEIGAECRLDCLPPDFCPGNINEPVNLEVGTRVVFTAFGTVRPGETGTLSNTATVTAPAGVSDPNPDNNTATDSDTLLSPLSDLLISQSVLPANPVPGQPVTLTISATSAGPSFARQNRVTSLIPEALTDIAWACVASPVPGLLDLVDSYSSGLSGDPDAIVATVISPDRNNLYALARDGATSVILQYERNASDGTLSAVPTAYVNGQGGIDGIGGATGAVFSADGMYLYVAASEDDSVAVFSRDTTTGDLTFVERQLDGLNGVVGLGGAVDVILSPNAQQLYAAG